MSDVTFTSGTPYRVAFDLSTRIMALESEKKERWTRERVLALYRECLQAVQQPGGRAEDWLETISQDPE